ncbi:MAG: hypothetical protein M1838_000878 [Thelocarpon superellum]|nr:MAG: hypothetical protein M1838_000878 [Thelocarpon superellum]
MPSAALNNRSSHGAKRQKLSNGTLSTAPARLPTSRIFAPFRTIGLVSSTTVPFTSIPLGKTTFQITTSVGRCLQTYDLRRGLHLVFLTRPQTPGTITATVAWKDRIFAAWEAPEKTVKTGVWVFKRGKKIDELAMSLHTDGSIRALWIFGSWIVGCRSAGIEVWKSQTYEHYTTLTPSRLPNRTTSPLLSGPICSLPTFLNKIFAAREDGSVEIWNLSTGKSIFTILPPSSNAGRVVALEPAPALALVAIAYEGGAVIVHDVRLDTTVLQLRLDPATKGVISSISFRTDGLGAGDDGRKAGVMATASRNSGDVTFWDLNQGGRIKGVLRGAHNPPSTTNCEVSGGINRVEFLSGQPVLVTGGLDNALKTWIFDETPFSPIPRILHARSGHAAPVTQLSFLPTEADGADTGGKWLLSAGDDRSLWAWSLRRDGQSTELSQGNVRKKARKLGLLGVDPRATEPSASLEDLKAPHIVCMATSLNRDGGMGALASKTHIWQNHRARPQKSSANDAQSSSSTGWESIVTGHAGDKLARTWFWGRKKAGRWAFETGDGGDVTSVAITPCGTFALVGSSLGCVDMFNLQSGLHRQRFPTKVTPAQARALRLQQASVGDLALVPHDGSHSTGFARGQGKHTKAVTGLMVDGINRTMVSCGLDGKVKFWDFATGTLSHEIDWSSMTAITAVRFHRANDLIALRCEDSCIRIIDLETRKVVRQLRGGVEPIHDLTFSHDGRWIVASSADSVLRVWDLPTGHLIDATRLDSVCTSLAFSSTGDFLATAHDDGVGVNIWNNRALFTHVPTRHLSEAEVAAMAHPTASGEGGEGVLAGAFADVDDAVALLDDSSVLADQLSQDLTTLSLVPRSRWQTLVHLDIIRQRNRPQEPPKAPEKAPFFLSAIDSAKQAEQGLGRDEDAQALIERSRIMKMDRHSAAGAFTTLLHAGHQAGDYEPFLTHLKSLSPAAVDLEIRSLRTQKSPSELGLFVSVLTDRLRHRLDYELVQAWMSVFLRLHAEVIAQDEAVKMALRAWRAEQEREATRLAATMGYCAGVVSFLRSAR